MSALMKRNLSLTILDQEKVEQIHEASLYLMENVGMKIGGTRALKLLQDNGAKTTSEGLTTIPRGLVEKALKSVPKELLLYTRDGELSMKIDRDNPVYFGTHADQLEIVDPLSGSVRKFLRKDTAMMCKLADFLPNIHFILSVGMSADVRPEVQSQITFLETVTNFSKTINFSTNDIESLKDIIGIAAIVAGGLQRLQEKPFIFNYCEPIPPLVHPQESTEKLYISAENRIPVVYMPYCMMGGTSPMSFAGTLAQCNADMLTGLVITQLVSEGAPFIYGSMPSVFDMRTTIGSYGAPEFHLLVAASSELAAYYGIPFFGTAGCTDAKVLDEQAVTETTMELFSTMLSKAHIIHDIGVMDHCNSVSPELVVLADEIIEGLKHYTQGVEVNGEELALEVIKEVGPGGHYLTNMHTLSNFRKVWYPDLFSRDMQNSNESQVKGRVKDKIKNIMENHQVPQLDQAILRELEKWFAKFE
ncbi:trimethylamine:corrinoid methyltransferase [Desulfosporosinus orientis DSM 765]|uniref:Trimethylamine:corrinoid methyltransferase n=1 Tax=Desulfosporosinus orientis (strain ATCC 19365 / DSM 765 / NCIMB 8382 / VKM B-1628 / Singapore I) TaxID=768706 RepID=G7W8J0_DESOD|nr:trimethylamine methyltransferase family protein [Desulfosporosinus orientis]AET67417.1 trimethylamine:corrinoid methyltransferase [Desulfosporosinus orientis DSM 765]